MSAQDRQDELLDQLVAAEEPNGGQIEVGPGYVAGRERLVAIAS